jgi:hypothetical protein
VPSMTRKRKCGGKKMVRKMRIRKLTDMQKVQGRKKSDRRGNPATRKKICEGTPMVKATQDDG